jgi:hypothetical protein
VIGDEKTLDMDGGDNIIKWEKSISGDWFILILIINLLSTRFGAFYKFNKK